MIYRRFWMTNSNNEVWEFTDKDVKAYLCSPEGLGLSNTLNTISYGESEKPSQLKYSLPTIKGEILFCDTKNSDRYEKYNDFVRFLVNAPLQLHYELPLDIPAVYTLECHATKLTKTESEKSRVMKCSLELQGLSFWKGTEITVTGTGTTFALENEGDFPVGFEILIEGSMIDPYFTLTKNSELYGEAKFVDASGTAFDGVYVNSNDAEQNVTLSQDGSTLANALSYQDLTISNGSIYVTFIKLARGKSTLDIGMDSGSITNVTIVYSPRYRSV